LLNQQHQSTEDYDLLWHIHKVYYC